MDKGGYSGCWLSVVKWRRGLSRLTVHCDLVQPSPPHRHEPRTLLIENPQNFTTQNCILFAHLPT